MIGHGAALGTTLPCQGLQLGLAGAGAVAGREDEHDGRKPGGEDQDQDRHGCTRRKGNEKPDPPDTPPYR